MGILNKEPHPGLVLQEKINSMHMSRSELAARTGVTEKHISTVINGNKGISPAFAKKLAYAFDEQASVWLNLQAKYDAYCAEIEAENNVSDEEKTFCTVSRMLLSIFLSKELCITTVVTLKRCFSYVKFCVSAISPVFPKSPTTLHTGLRSNQIPQLIHLFCLPGRECANLKQRT